ncbi:MAG TPA: carbon-nitrogen hydrolase family protein [Candidatus Acidoferrum sp.]|nr:carbon-nitrogen hydrolase family protein [Candidatus Acidoferrum sp.]
MTATHLTVALAQYSADRDSALIVEEARNAGAEIVVFPEMFSNGYARFNPEDAAAFYRWRKGAHASNGTFVKKFRDAAKNHQLYVVATFLEDADPKPFNSALLIDPDGNGVLHHRKVHTCDFDSHSPDAACGRGERFDVVGIQTSAGPINIGLMICMDREYPEAARSLSGRGAEIILAPNSCRLAADGPYGDVRIAQARGRAFETVTGIAVANYPVPLCDGHSFAVDPTGTVIVIAADSPGLTIAAFDLELIRRLREEDHFRWRQ